MILNSVSNARSIKRLDQAQRLGDVAEAAVERQRGFVGRPDVEGEHTEAPLPSPCLSRPHQRPPYAPAPRSRGDGHIGDVTLFDARYVRAYLQRNESKRRAVLSLGDQDRRSLILIVHGLIEHLGKSRVETVCVLQTGEPNSSRLDARPATKSLSPLFARRISIRSFMPGSYRITAETEPTKLRVTGDCTSRRTGRQPSLPATIPA